MDANQTNEPEEKEVAFEPEEETDAASEVENEEDTDEQSGPDATAGTNDKMERIMSLENMITGYMADLEKLQKDYKEQRSMLKDAFENDAEYQGVQEQMKELRQKRKEIKDKIIEDPGIATLDARVSDLRAEVKDVKQALNDYTMQYFQESGMRQITGTDGEVREIVTTVKLVKKRD